MDIIGIFIVEHELHKGLFDTCKLGKSRIFFNLDTALEFIESNCGVEALRSHTGFIATSDVEDEEYGVFESWTIRSPLIFDILGIGLGS